jgi:hypothetical protein
MSTQPLVGYGGYTPEQYQRIIRRAHAERAKALHEFFSALLAWRWNRAERQAAKPHHAAAACH